MMKRRKIRNTRIFDHESRGLHESFWCQDKPLTTNQEHYTNLWLWILLITRISDYEFSWLHESLTTFIRITRISGHFYSDYANLWSLTTNFLDYTNLWLRIFLITRISDYEFSWLHESLNAQPRALYLESYVGHESIASRDARDSRNPLGSAFNGLSRDARDSRNPLDSWSVMRDESVSRYPLKIANWQLALLLGRKLLILLYLIGSLRNCGVKPFCHSEGSKESGLVSRDSSLRSEWQVLES